MKVCSLLFDRVVVETELSCLTKYRIYPDGFERHPNTHDKKKIISIECLFV